MRYLRFGIIVLLSLVAHSSADYEDGYDYGVDDDPENDYLHKCFKRCDNTTSCKALDRMKSRRKVENCVDLLYEACEDKGNKIIKCLSQKRGSTKGSCTKKISSMAVPCLKCNAKCQRTVGHAGGDEMEEDDGRDDSNRCLQQCRQTKQCKALDKMSSGMIKNCDEFAKRYCGKLSDIECARKMKNKENVKCPKLIRAKSLSCWKCKETCEHIDDDYRDEDFAEDDDEDDKNEETACEHKCVASCKTFEASKNEKMRRCMELVKTRCPKESDDINCLESIRNVADDVCSQSFRRAAIKCLKCGRKCEIDDEEDSGDLPEDENRDKCIGDCGSTPGCKNVNEASPTIVEACEHFVERKCGNAMNISECVNKLNHLENESCPIWYRMNMTACLACDDQCLGQSGADEMSPCAKNCSKTEACVAVASEGESTIWKCDDWIAKFCVNYTSVDTCLETNSIEDEGCPEAFRRQIARCARCSKHCKAELESSNEVNIMTKEKCEETCHISDACSSGNRNATACSSCVVDFCGTAKKSFECLLSALVDQCQNSCFPYQKACKDCKDACAVYQ